MDYDKVWVNRGHTENMKKVNTIMTKTHWSGVKVGDGFFEELERVMPALGIVNEGSRCIEIEEGENYHKLRIT